MYIALDWYSVPEKVSTKPLSGDTRNPQSDIQMRNQSVCNHGYRYGYRCMKLWTGTLFQRKYQQNHCLEIPEVHGLKYRSRTGQCVIMVTDVFSSGLVLYSRGRSHKTIVWRWSTVWNTDRYSCKTETETMSHLMTKPTKWMCAQQRLRSALASAQSDQSLCCALN